MADYVEIKGKLREIIEYWEQEDSVADEDVKTYLEDLADYIQKVDCFKLYKYCPPDYYSFRNFEVEQVRLSPNGYLNDVYEGIPAYEGEIEGDELKGLSSMALTSCFSERCDSVLMWAHYAGSSEGFCVEYDLKKLTRDEIIDLGIYPVLYNEDRLIYRDVKELANNLKDLEEAMEKEYEYDDVESLRDLIPLMLCKGKDWEYEREWRIICTKMDLYNQYNKSTSGICVPLKCVSGVILGYRMEESKKKHIREIINNKMNNGENITIYQAQLTNNSFEFSVDVID